MYVKRLAGLVSGLTFTHMCTHARSSMHGGDCFNPGAWCGWWFDGGAPPAATATPFSTRTPLSRVTLCTLTTRTMGQAPPHRKQSCVLLHNHAHSSLNTPLSCNTHNGAVAGVTRSTRTVRGSGLLASERCGGIASRVSCCGVGVAVLTSGHA
jgi:hypothetical protein